MVRVKVSKGNLWAILCLGFDFGFNCCLISLCAYFSLCLTSLFRVVSLLTIDMGCSNLDVKFETCNLKFLPW